MHYFMIFVSSLLRDVHVTGSNKESILKNKNILRYENLVKVGGLE